MLEHVFLFLEGLASRCDATPTPLRRASSYPEIYVEVAGATEFPVTSLESDSHCVIVVQGLVKALDAVGGQHDVVRAGDLEGHRRHSEQ